MAGSVANSEDNASLFIHKDHISPGAPPSEADSDDRRKRLSNELKKAFDQYMQSAQIESAKTQNIKADGSSSVGYAVNHNVEFETLSEGSKSNTVNMRHGSSQLGKRMSSRDAETIREEMSSKDEMEKGI